MLKITTPPPSHDPYRHERLTGRVDGSIGLTLDDPVISITAKKSDVIEVTGDSEHAQRMKNSAAALLPEGEGICINIEKDYPSHHRHGFRNTGSSCCRHGSEQTVRPGFKFERDRFKVGREEQADRVAAFEKGGFILDGGHKFSEKKHFFHPRRANFQRLLSC